MKNTYAKEYYDDYLKNLPTDYKSARWFSGPESKLDYEQTRRSLESALGNAQFSSVLEIGPGDGVWTDLILPKLNTLTLLDQSVEMLDRAKERLKDHNNVTYVRSDFLQFQETKKFDLIFAIRCFEYFEDQKTAMKKMSSLLNPGGILIIVTKNPEHATMKKVQQRELHKGQISQSNLNKLMSESGFEDVRNLSATWRFKAKYAAMRLIFSSLHKLHVASKGYFFVPFLTKPLTESYLYVAKKK